MDDNADKTPGEHVTRVIDQRSRRYGWPFAVICVAGIAAVLVAYLRSLATVEKMGEKIGGIADSFKAGTITQTWTEEVTRIAASEGQPLEVGVIETVVSFRIDSKLKILWNALPLGTTTTEITVPATYRYHIRLSDDWLLETDGQTCLVLAPKIRPTLPVAFDTSRMSKRTEKGWAHIGHEEQMQAQETVLTPHLNSLAESKIPLVREQCRQVVADFVRQWLLREAHWQQDRFSAVKVLFVDEKRRTFEDADTTVILE